MGVLLSLSLFLLINVVIGLKGSINKVVLFGDFCQVDLAPLWIWFSLRIKSTILICLCLILVLVVNIRVLISEIIEAILIIVVYFFILFKIFVFQVLYNLSMAHHLGGPLLKYRFYLCFFLYIILFLACSRFRCCCFYSMLSVGFV